MPNNFPDFAVALNRAAADDIPRVLRGAEEQYRLIVETTSEGIWVIDPDNRTTFVNEAMASMLGYAVEEMLGHSVFEFVDDEGARHAATRIAQRRTGVSERVQARYKRADGTTLDAMLCGNALFGNNGEYVGALGVVSDMTELRRSQDTVSARVRQLETIAELGRDILAGLSFDHLLARVGSSVALALEIDRVSVLEVLEDGRLSVIAGYGWDEGVVGNMILPANNSLAGFQVSTGTPRLIVEDMLQEERFSPSPAMLESGMRGGLSCLIEGDGAPFGVLAALTHAPRSFTEEDSNFLASVAQLISSVVRRDQLASLGLEAEEELRSTAERRHSLEEQLRQSQKLEAIGQLAGGIAHDFNNLLLALRGYGELALRRLERGDPKAANDIAEMLEATNRAAALTQQLLAFGRRQLLNPEVIDLCGVVTDMDKLLRRLIGEQVELVTLHGDEPVLVEVDRSQLEQVIANLAVNARDAMPEGGRLEIEVANDAAGQAVLSVADTGCGMDDATAARVFEPFFTTKGENGTGLGLATVHGIVSQSGGRISVASELGNGTTFQVFLPLADGVPTPAASSHRRQPAAPSRSSSSRTTRWCARS